MDLKFNKSESFRLVFILIASSSLFLVMPYYLVIAYAHHLDSKPAKIVLEDSNLDVEIVTEGLEYPTGMVFLNPNEILVLEKGR